MVKRYLIIGATGSVGKSSKMIKEDSNEAHLVGKNEAEISKLEKSTDLILLLRTFKIQTLLKFWKKI